MTAIPAPPLHIGPAEFSSFGEKWVAVRCPSDLGPLMQQAGGLWEVGSRRWPIHRRRTGPLSSQPDARD